MAIITISKASYSIGTEIAKLVAQKIGGQCVSRESLLETLEEFNAPTMKLMSSFDDLSSIFERFKYGRHRYITEFQAAFYSKMVEDKSVYHGFAGQFFVKNISHALKVCIFAPAEDRIKRIMERENISLEKASEQLKRIDDQRQKWGRYLYDIDIRDGSQYDLTLNLDTISIESAADTICRLAESDPFQMTSDSEKELRGLAIASRVRLALPDRGKHVEVKAYADGTVTLKGALSNEDDIQIHVEKAKSITEVTQVVNEIELHPDYMDSWGMQ